MANQKVKISPQELIPEYWHGIYVPTEDDLIFIGSKNIDYLRQYWEDEERGLSRQMQKIQDDIDLLAGKTVDDIKAMAAKYENPVFPKIGVGPERWAKDPEPLDEASIKRKAGTTTFNVCGWCKHCGGGSVRYDYYITTSCPFIPRELGNGEVWGGNDAFRFNTPCALTNGTQELLDTCVEHLKARKAKVTTRKQQAASYVNYLAEVMEKAEEKPYFSYHRPCEWFSIGERVMFFTMGHEGVLPDRINVFISGKVIDGYRYHDGCVSVCADEPYHSGDYCEGCGAGFGISRPEVLHDWEYEYLKSHPDYLKVWLRCANAAGMEGFNSVAFTTALTKA